MSAPATPAAQTLHWPYPTRPAATGVELRFDDCGGLVLSLTVTVGTHRFDVYPARDGGADVFQHGADMEVCPSEIADAAGGYDNGSEPDRTDVDACYQFLLHLWADASQQVQGMCVGTLGRAVPLVLASVNRAAAC